MVSELLGHSDVKTTLGTYAQVEAEDFREPLNERATQLLGQGGTDFAVQLEPNGTKSPVFAVPAGSGLLN
jgi:hypothetical protein